MIPMFSPGRLAPLEKADILGYVNRLNIFLLLAVSIHFRIAHLEHIPAINGDEAFYGVRMLELAQGQLRTFVTPTGNVINPFFSGIIYLLQMVFPPAFWILRFPALVSGILQIGFCYVLVKAVSDKRAALIATIVTATLPVNILYSRFGWDASQTGLASLFVMYFALRRQWAALVVALLAALVVHPTNVFLIPIVMVLILGEVLCAVHFTGLRKLAIAGAIVGLSACAVGSFAYLRFGSAWFGGARLMAGRFLDFTGWYDFVILYGRLLTGITSLQYISGFFENAVIVVMDGGFAVVFLTLLALGGGRLCRRRRRRPLVLMAGLFVAAVAFYLVAGNVAISPHYERYALFLIVPSILCFTDLLTAFFSSRYREEIVVGIVCLMGWMGLAEVKYCYFEVFRTTGGLSHETFRTASVEPKQQAYEYIQKLRPGEKDITIYTENWWLYWPIKYLSFQKKSIHVVNIEDGKNVAPGELLAGLKGGACLVSFHSQRVETFMRDDWVGRPLGRYPIQDYAGGDLLDVWYLPK